MARTQVTGENVLDDSIKGIDVEEETLDVEKVPFSDSGFTATNTKDAIIEAKSGTFDVNCILTDGISILVDISGNVLIKE